MEITEFDFLHDIVEAQEKLEAAKSTTPPTPPTEDPKEEEEEDDNSAKEKTSEDSTKKETEPAAEGDEEEVDYEPYFNFLKEQGVIMTPEDFKFDGTEESFAKALDATKDLQYKSAVEELWKSLPETGKPLLKYFLEGGTDVNKYIEAYSEVNLDNIDLDDEDNQIKVLRQYYKEIFNYTDEKTDKLISRLQAKEGLKEGALDAVEDLKEHKTELQKRLIEDAKAERERAQKAAQKERELLTASLKELDSARQSKIEAILFNPIKTEDGVTTEFNYYLNKISATPKHLVQLADLLVDYNPEKGFNLERFEQRVLSNKTKAFRALIDSKSGPKRATSQGATPPRTEESHFPFDKFLNS